MEPIRRRGPSAPFVIFLLALLVALFATPAVGSSAGSLTTRAVKKIATKVANKQIKKKASGLTVSRAADADALGGVPASAYSLRGGLQLSLGPSSWVPFTTTEVVARSLNSATVSVASAGNHFYTLDLQAPIAADGVRLRMTGIRYCFGASANVALTAEELSVFSYTSGVGTPLGPSVANLFHVQTPGCRVFPTDTVLGPQDNATFVVTFNTGGPAAISLGAVTVQFEPTDQPLAPLG